MRFILGILISVLLGFPISAHASVDPTGTWKIELASPDGSTRKREATFTKEEDSIKGSLYNPDRDRTVPLVVVTDESDNQIRFTFSWQESSIAYAGKIEGNSMSGSANFNINGQQFDTTFSATREAKTSSLAGTWESKLESNGRARTGTITITLGNDGALSAKLSSQRGTSELQDIKLENGVVTFVKPGSDRANVLRNYRGLLDGDDIKGEMIMNGSPDGQEGFSWTATKVD